MKSTYVKLTGIALPFLVPRSPTGGCSANKSALGSGQVFIGPDHESVLTKGILNPAAAYP
jgi:hypothetical protein